ncbi:MAG: cytidylyltransferase domain-containing protein [Brevinema sp.]
MRKKIFVGIQSRLNSTRFPRKAFVDILGIPLIIRVIQRIQKVHAPLEIVILTPKNEEEEFIDFLDAHHCNVPVFGGSEIHVLERYYQAATSFHLSGADIIMRVTGDNPLISIILCERLIAMHQDYDLSHFLGNPSGTGVELIKFEALEKSYMESTDPFEHEHVTQYIYKNRKTFHIFEPQSPYTSSDINCVSVDYPEDILTIKEILNKNPLWDLDDLS